MNTERADLVHSRFDVAVLDELLKLFEVKVADSNAPTAE